MSTNTKGRGNNTSPLVENRELSIIMEQDDSPNSIANPDGRQNDLNLIDLETGSVHTLGEHSDHARVNLFGHYDDNSVALYR
ncbi:MAG: hypothetical protein V4496_07535 [Pseudomonadota bacterium]